MLKKALFLFREKTIRILPIRIPAARATGKYFSSTKISIKMYFQVCWDKKFNINS